MTKEESLAFQKRKKIRDPAVVQDTARLKIKEGKGIKEIRKWRDNL